jgi:hypothetical protein
MARSFIPKMAIPSSLPRDSQGAKMFKRRAADQRIFPLEPATPSIASALTPMATSETSADLAYLHHVSDEEREGYASGQQPPSIHYPVLPGFNAVGYMFRRLSLRG